MPTAKSEEEPKAKKPVRKRQPATAAAKQKQRPPYILLAITLPYVIFLCALAYADRTGPEQWWWSSLNLYLPQLVWTVPGFLLIVLYAIFRWKWSWVPLTLLIWAFTGQMGYNWRLVTPAVDLNKGVKLRFMTYNIKAGRIDLHAIFDDIQEQKPDVILFQESHRGNAEQMKEALEGWNIVSADQFLVASQLPLTQAEAKVLTSGDSHLTALRTILTVHGKAVTLFTAHLHSPRSGLVTTLKHTGQADEAVTENTDVRLHQAKMLADYLRNEGTPLILTGDLNAPVQSQVCREFFDLGMKDAFSESGRGYGFTYGQYVKPLHRPYLRIDHILFSHEFTAVNCWAGNTQGSEHRPVFADLYLPN